MVAVTADLSFMPDKFGLNPSAFVVGLPPRIVLQATSWDQLIAILYLIENVVRFIIRLAVDQHFT